MARGFPGVRRHQEPSSSMSYDPVKRATTFGGGLETGGQVRDLGGGQFGVTGKAGTHGDVSPNFLDDPLINHYAKLPSLKEASEYMHTKPTFHGVQRPGDYQRVVQRYMADEASGGTLSRQLEQRAETNKWQRGDLSENKWDVDRMSRPDPVGDRRRQREDLDLEPRPLRDRGIGGDADAAERLMRSVF
jgi:hypothetical protein